ncbi:MAG: tRNA pseudouridine(38-40) synthase TruA, partial [Candidatus Competibacteraceae bacterium]|nr:tRNA pseudouridine(38-40) synthase TruA [Candidatus Competibacteraceae bacterium]
MRIAIGLEYDGSRFRGWQLQQPGVATVQGTLERALGRVAAQPVNTVCAGRTDAGVHGMAQVVHFDSDARRPLHAWVMGGNA